jgi:hypothetical protein
MMATRRYRRVNDHGYVDVYRPRHPLARADGYVPEHRMMAWDAGLLTNPNDDVHHVDECKTHNELSNFEIKSRSQHTREHQEDRGHVTNQYGTFPVFPRHQRQSARYGVARLRRKTLPCRYCGREIPATKRRDAKFCSQACQISAWKRSHR